MTKCLLKALKAVNLQNHLELFRILGYDSAGALAHFHPEHFKQLHLTDAELARFHSLLEVLKQATKAGKICPHYCKSSRPSRSNLRNDLHRGSSATDAVQYRTSPTTRQRFVYTKKNSCEDLKSKRSRSSTGITARSSSTSLSRKQNGDEFLAQRPTSMIIENRKKNNQQSSVGPKSVINRPAVEHVKANSYNYGVPKSKQQQRSSNHRTQYKQDENIRQSSVFTVSSRNTPEVVSYAKPAEIYVYARKRPLLCSEITFEDIITIPNNKSLILAENKSNLDSTPLLKKTEFHFDHVFGADASNKHVFDHTIRSFLLTKQRQNLTYICFGQTGSGKSHTIFGSRNTDGLLVYCVQLLLQEITSHTKLVGLFYEIYNNQVQDLSSPGKRLVVREDSDHHVHVIGGTETVLTNLEALRLMIDDGLARRHHGRSAFNSNSSRSHAVFQVTFKDNYQKSDSFKLTFIDLAGSERATDAKNNQRQTRREGAQINSSLLALKECIRSMDLTNFHAPFRQSKLTHILRDSLVGSKTRTCLLANVSPADDCCQCSLNTLQYASRIRDISIRHRHRVIASSSTLSNNYFDEPNGSIKSTTNKNKPQTTFKPATASTPVHRLLSSVDHRLYMATNPPGNNNRVIRTAKPSNVDWRLAEHDRPIIRANGDDLASKSVFSATREIPQHHHHSIQQPTSSFYNSRFDKQQPKHTQVNDGTSSYFPPPQPDMKPPMVPNNKKSKETNDVVHRAEKDQVERQLKSVPAPPLASGRRLSDSSIEQTTSTRLVPVALLPLSDDNQYSSATGTESLGTKITKLATGTNLTKKKRRSSGMVEHLNLHKHHDTPTTSTLTSETEQGLYSDRQATHRDQTGFFSNRDDPFYEKPYLPSSPLSMIAQETSSLLSPAKTPTQSYNYSDPLHSSSYRNMSHNSFSSPLKGRNRHRTMKSSTSSRSSSSSTLSDGNRSPSPQRRHGSTAQHRIIPLRIDQYSDSEDMKIHRDTLGRKSENSQFLRNIPLVNREKEETDDRFLKDQFNDSNSPSLSKYLSKSTPDQIKQIYDPSSPISASLLSPTNDHSIRVSDQLNTLRSLLESRLREQDDSHHHLRDSSILQSSPGTFAKEFLRSYQQTDGKNSSAEIISDVDDDNIEYLRSLRRTPTYFDRENSYCESPSKSPIVSHQYANSLNKNQSSSLLFSSTLPRSTIAANGSLSPSRTLPINVNSQNEKYETRPLSNGTLKGYSVSSMTKTHPASTTESDLTEITSNPTNGSARTDLTETSSDVNASNSSASIVPRRNVFESNEGTHDSNQNFLDSGKGSSLLSGTSFDALMNSLRSMREKDLDFLAERKDETLIRVNH